MPKVLENVITAAVPHPESGSVTLTWANGATTENSFRHVIGKGVFAPLADPAFFTRVRIGVSGRSLEWPGELDFCADALWFDVHPEDAPQPPARAGNQRAKHPTP
jgi:hypothetical protein